MKSEIVESFRKRYVSETGGSIEYRDWLELELEKEKNKSADLQAQLDDVLIEIEERREFPEG